MGGDRCFSKIIQWEEEVMIPGCVPVGRNAVKAQLLSLALLGDAKWIMKGGNSSVPEEVVLNFDM